MKSSLNSDVPSTHLKLPKGNFWDIAHPYKLFTSKYLRYDYFLFMSWSFMYLLLAFGYRWIAWHIPPLIPFFTINNISISVIRSNFTLILVQYENEQGQVHIFKDTYLGSCQIHQLTIMYHFEQTNHDINLNFLFLKFYRLFFWVRVIFISNIFHV